MSTEEDREYVEYVSAAFDRLRRTAYLLCGDGHRADDIVQATLVSLYLHWGRVRKVESIDGYVHRILVRRFIDERRASWAKVLLAWRDTSRPAPPERSVEDSYAVSDALAGLPRGQRAVLVLRYFCDLSIQDTAAALGCTTGTVKSQTARGLAALRDLLGEEWQPRAVTADRRSVR